MATHLEWVQWICWILEDYELIDLDHCPSLAPPDIVSGEWSTALISKHASILTILCYLCFKSYDYEHAQYSRDVTTGVVKPPRLVHSNIQYTIYSTRRLIHTISDVARHPALRGNYNLQNSLSAWRGGWHVVKLASNLLNSPKSIPLVALIAA